MRTFGEKVLCQFSTRCDRAAVVQVPQVESQGGQIIPKLDFRLSNIKKGGM